MEVEHTWPAEYRQTGFSALTIAILSKEFFATPFILLVLMFIPYFSLSRTMLWGLAVTGLIDWKELVKRFANFNE